MKIFDLRKYVLRETFDYFPKIADPKSNLDFGSHDVSYFETLFQSP